MAVIPVVLALVIGFALRHELPLSPLANDLVATVGAAIVYVLVEVELTRLC